MSRTFPLLVQSEVTDSSQPVIVGVPMSRGSCQRSDHWQLTDAAGTVIPLQTEPLAFWPDGSVRWLLLDFVARPLGSGTQEWRLAPAPQAGSGSPKSPSVVCRENEILTGAADFQVGRIGTNDFLVTSRTPVLKAILALTDTGGVQRLAHIEGVVTESAGPVRATVCIRGSFPGAAPCRFIARMCFFAGLGTVRFRITLHNPRRARRHGNLWDLGDPGSIQFRDLTLELRHGGESATGIRWSSEPGGPIQEVMGRDFELFQASSGGENWNSRNHVNRLGQVANPFRGYRVRAGNEESQGLRANPVVQRLDARSSVAVAVPEFWQQFPKAIEVNSQCLFVRLFPQQFGDLFELQGGEQKTHVVWMDLGNAETGPGTLDWVHRPAVVSLSPQAYCESGAFPDITSTVESAPDQFDDYANRSLSGPASLIAGREVIDEYGWRNFGDIYADHENAYSSSPRPIISHYNNQFDSIYGALLQFARTGDRRWRDLADPLARHVVDIDIYHTVEDRAAYRGGLFWMTDHYKNAASSTHRTFSRANQKPGQSYGGGPGSEHNFTTGLLYYHWMTGDPLAREAVISLADWVIRMDDGRQSQLARLDSSPTGLASMTGSADYHGPGRGPGLSINALLDGWLLTGERKYLDYAEVLIRRCIHPNDDVAARDLLDIESRWSYTIFLTSLARYLRVKAETGDRGFMYAYARASLVRYAGWMAEHEKPNFDQRERMEFPTETWAAQDFRKANVLRLAAAYVDEPTGQRFLARAQTIADRAWQDLVTFESRHVARAVAIILTEGTRDQYFRRLTPERDSAPVEVFDFGAPEPFVTQKARIKSMMRSPRGWLQLMMHLAGFGPKPTS